MEFMSIEMSMFSLIFIKLYWTTEKVVDTAKINYLNQKLNQEIHRDITKV